MTHSKVGSWRASARNPASQSRATGSTPPQRSTPTTPPAGWRSRDPEARQLAHDDLKVALDRGEVVAGLVRLPEGQAFAIVGERRFGAHVACYGSPTPTPWCRST